MIILAWIAVVVPVLATLWVLTDRFRQWEIIVFLAVFSALVISFGFGITVLTDHYGSPPKPEIAERSK